MKHIKFVSFLAVFLLGTLLILGCKPDSIPGFFSALKGSGHGPAGEANFSKDASYALGYDVGMNWEQIGIIPDFDELIKGLKDAYSKETPRISRDDMYSTINEAYMALQAELSEANKQKEIDYLAQNSRNPGIVITESGLQYEVLSEGRGAHPTAGDTVRVHYEGTLIDGTIFDSSYERGEPVEFPVSGVIPGWTEGLQLMGEGASYRFFIPSELAYGQYGSGQVIPPYSALIFKVELISIIK